MRTPLAADSGRKYRPTHRSSDDDNVLSIPRSFIRLTGDINSALLLSQLVYWTGRCSNADGWVYKSRADWKEELGLGRYQSENARRRLSGLGLIEQKCCMAGGRRTMHFRVRHDALQAALHPVEPSRAEQAAGCSPANRTAVHQPTEEMDTSIPDGCDPADRDAAPRHTDAPDTSRPITQTTSEITTETTINVAPAEPEPDRQSPEPRDAPETQGEQIEERERQLSGLLDRLPAFRSDPDIERLREVLDDYPDETTVLEFKKFVEHWRTRTLKHPWSALRNWLDRERYTTMERTRKHRRGDRTTTQSEASRCRLPRTLPATYTAPPVYDD